MKKKFKISVIIPVYNVYDYLRETIESVVNQDIGFKNIELILMNDGSPDNSEEICLEYKEKYPDNVIYVKKENSGVSDTRNKGMEYATGEYIHFLDSDDKISKNFYRVGYNFMKKHNVKLCFYRIRQFDAKTSLHNLDWKFKGKKDRVVDYRTEPMNPNYYVTATLYESELAKSVKYDTKLKISEDFKYLCDLIVKSPVVGHISSALFYYRRRKGETSAIQTAKQKLTYYVDTPERCFQYLLDLGKEYPELKAYLQIAVANDIIWRMTEVDFTSITEEQRKTYMAKIHSLLDQIDDNYITCLHQVKAPHDWKWARLLEYKYSEPLGENLAIKKDYLYYKNIRLFNKEEIKLNVYKFEVNKNKLIINILFNSFLNFKNDIYLKTNNKYYKFKRNTTKERADSLLLYLGKYTLSEYELDLDYKSIGKTSEIYIKIGNEYVKGDLNFNSFAKLNILPHTYYKTNKSVLTCRKNTIYKTRRRPFVFTKYMLDLLRKKELVTIAFILLYYLTYPFVKHNNWLVSDRYDAGSDNGEALFKYINQNKIKKNVYFCISKKSKDLDRIKEYGKVIYFGTPKYYLKYLNSEAIISSHIDNYIFKPFGRKTDYLNNLIKSKFVFLQHGIIKDDLSDWLKKSNKNISIFITSNEKEYKSILNYDYLYDESVVKLTGLARYDNLIQDKEPDNIIALMPTWRSSLVAQDNPKTGKREHNDKFIESDYYKFYNTLINDEELLKVLKKYKYKIKFCLHPAFSSQLKDFKTNDYVSIDTKVDYNKVFKESKLLITDYSSVAFDFAYLKKPVIYTQFDKDIINEIHIYEESTYFSYKDNGFGDIANDYEEALELIVDSIENGCKMSKKYLDRYDKFFKYKDNKNCERTIKEINKLLEK